MAVGAGAAVVHARGQLLVAEAAPEGAQVRRADAGPQEPDCLPARRGMAHARCNKVLVGPGSKAVQLELEPSGGRVLRVPALHQLLVGLQVCLSATGGSGRDASRLHQLVSGPADVAALHLCMQVLHLLHLLGLGPGMQRGGGGGGTHPGGGAGDEV